jgi:polyisoprenoid-binding protein YceI
MPLYWKNLTGTVALVSILSACSATQEVTTPEEPAQKPETPAAEAPEASAETAVVAEPAPAIPEERVFKVNGEASLVEIRVYREGRLARLSHNHIISSKDLQGSVILARDIRNSSLDLQLPVTTLIVDDPALRQEAEKDFNTAVAESDIEGTRTNMLGEKVLDAKNFPKIRVRAKVAGGKLPVLELDASLRILGISNSLKIPVKVETDGDQLTASGIFDIHQSEFGMKPFSTLVGALKVKDKLTIRFRIVARKRAPTD